ncbi:hypothetical protein GCM10027589_39660 [Actinocorallia lasiicapitis]
MSENDAWGGLEFGPDLISEEIATGVDNPWMTIGIMNGIKEESLLAKWDAVLDIQTRLFGPRENAWLERQGFARPGTKVLEVGSGNGDHGRYLAQSFADARFFGVEANPYLARRYQDTVPNYRVDVCRFGDQELPEPARQEFSDCFLRYTLQHISDPLRVLREVYDLLPIGGRVFIVEEDINYSTCQPAWRAHTILRDSWRSVLETGGSDHSIGCKLPGMVAEAGFEVREFDISLRTNIELGNGFLDFYRLALSMFQETDPALVSQDDVDTMVKDFEADWDTHQHRFVVTHPQVLLMAEKTR